MTDKYDNFIKELEALCDKHDVSISCSGYDSLQVWDRKDEINVIHFNGIEDMTRD